MLSLTLDLLYFYYFADDIKTYKIDLQQSFREKINR